jgi:hypothetical protein
MRQLFLNYFLNCLFEWSMDDHMKDPKNSPIYITGMMKPARYRHCDCKKIWQAQKGKPKFPRGQQYGHNGYVFVVHHTSYK